MRLLGREERRRGELAALDERGVRLGVAVHEVRDELRVGELGGQDIVGGELGAAEDGLERAIATDETDGDLDRVLALVDDLDVMLVAGGGDDRGVDLKRGELAVADDGRGPKPVDTLRGVGNAAVSNRGDADSILAREVVLDLEGAVRRDVLNLPKQRLEVRVDELAVDDGEGNGALVGAGALDAEGRGAGGRDRLVAAHGGRGGWTRTRSEVGGRQGETRVSFYTAIDPALSSDTAVRLCV